MPSSSSRNLLYQVRCGPNHSEKNVESIVVTWRELLVAGAIVAVIYIAEAGLFLAKLKRTPASRLPALDALQSRMAMLEEELAELRLQLAAIKSVSAIPSVVEAPPPVATPDSGDISPSAYGRAIELARQGLDADWLSANCGISRGEAELIIALHRFDST